MKSLCGYLSLFLTVILLLFPLIPNKKVSAQPVLLTQPQEDKEITFRLKQGEEIKTIGAKDYIIGVVSAEMPALYNEEALKAQAVAAYTFAIKRKQENTANNYDITDDFTTDQSYIDTQKQKEKWGDKYGEYSEKISKAVTSVLGKTVQYKGEYALTVYTAYSTGKTESAKNVWGKDIPYLTPVDSVGDMLCPDYLSTVSLSEAQIKEKLPKIKDIAAKDWFSSPTYSDSSTVMSMKFADTVLTGSEIKTALSLKSAAFEVKNQNGTFVFTVRGYGHLVGMSQYGANYMAMQGSTYEEILKWYYKGCEVV